MTPDEIPDGRRDGADPGRVLWRNHRASGHRRPVRMPSDKHEDWNGGAFGYVMRAAGFVGSDINVSELAAIVENVIEALSYLPQEERDRLLNGVDLCLAGRMKYDDLTDLQQAVVREAWAERLDSGADGIDLTAHLEAEGHRWWVVADPDGTIRREGPDA